METYRLYGHLGWGSALIEAQLVWYGIAYEFVDAGNLFEDGAALSDIKKLNPAGQVPVLVAPNGEVMTESAAITLSVMTSPFGATSTGTCPAGFSFLMSDNAASSSNRLPASINS